jgi:VWFA-related protein
MILRSITPTLPLFTAGMIVFGLAPYCLNAQSVTPPTTAQPLSTVQSDAGNPQVPYTLHVTNQAVVLDVVVNDKDGQPKENLTRDDFAIFENKIPQTILSFERSTPPTSGTTHQPVSISSTADLDKMAPAAPVTIIVLDELTTTFEDGAFALYSLKKYLNTQSDTLQQPTMLLATNYDNLMVLRDYTTSKKEILDALNHHFAGYNFRAKSKSWMQEQMNGAFGALTSVAQATIGHSGHKNVLWIGRGFPPIRWDLLPAEQAADLQQAIATCVNTLRDARITLYSIDPAGLTINPVNGEDDGTDTDPFGGQIDFDSMVTATGGQSFHGRNDVDHLIGTTVRDGETFYTLSYKPSTISQDEKAFRKIKVVMRNPNLVATTREGYFTTTAPTPPPEDANGHPSDKLITDMALAGQGLMVYDGVPLTVTRDTQKRDSFLLSFPASTLLWQKAADKQSSEFTYLVEGFDKKGKLLSHSAQELAVHLPTLPENTAEKRNMAFTVTVATASPVARVRFVVRSDGNGKIGTENYYLIAPTKLSDPATGRKPTH